MKHLRTVEVPSTQKQIVDFVSCDLCGEKIEHEGHYETNEIEVRHKVGSSYPEGGSGTETKVDLCDACFDGRLIPWIVSQGGKPQTNEWDW